MFYLQASYQDKLEKNKRNLYIYKLNYKNSIFNKMNINGKKAKIAQNVHCSMRASSSRDFGAPVMPGGMGMNGMM